MLQTAMVKRKGNLDDEEETLPNVSEDFAMILGWEPGYINMCVYLDR